ncbi:MAG: RluA family pseudouridine synthase [Planctomycetes bacterium]|nr:RluA family pseudouridine synthase [Planctomycetota bacterium]
MQLIPEEGELSILHEDEHMLVVNKSSGLLSQPNPGTNTGSILNIILAHGHQLEGGDDESRQGLVHRLDKDTSGILVLSKTQEAYQTLQNSFRLREVEKEYHFLAFGKLLRMEFTSRLPLGRHPKKRNTRMHDENGRDAETHFKLMELGRDKYSMWKASPKTGRTHQIRIHAAEAGLYIVGDPHYSKHNACKTIQGKKITHTMLHSQTLSLPHPESKEKINFTAPYPEDYLAVKSLISKK